MRLPIFLVVLPLCCGAAQREVYYQGPLSPNSIVPTFDKGYLMVYNGAKVDLYSPDGWPLYSAAPVVPDTDSARIQNAATDTDGALAAAVAYGDKRKHGGGIALFDHSGKQIQFFDTYKYLPTQLAFADDHTIWTLGWQGFPASHDDYLILRHYSEDGQELGAFLHRSTFDAEHDPVGPNTGLWQLRVAGNRIGALFYESSILSQGQQLLSMVWVEFDLNGKELGRWDVGHQWVPDAFTTNGALYRLDDTGVSRLDRLNGTWRHAGGASGRLIGADGNDLVFLVRGTNTLRWVPATQ